MEIKNIDILSQTSLNKKYDVQPSFARIVNDNVLVGLNSVELNTNHNQYTGRNECSVAKISLQSGNIEWEHKFVCETRNLIKCPFVIIDNKLIGCSYYALFSINLNSGDVFWSKNLKKHTCPSLSKIGTKVFWTNWGHLHEIEPKTGKIKQTLKPRVKWFCGRIIEHKNRHFVATSNSKILELNLNDLSVINEFKYPGGWSIGYEPYFLDNLMVSNSSGSKLKIFDLDSNCEIKSFNSPAGAMPLQKGFNKLFLSYNSNRDNKLSCYDLVNLKRKWQKIIDRIQDIYIGIDEFEIIFKQEGKYKIGKLNLKKPNDIEVLLESEFDHWENYHFDLWEGVGISKSAKYSIYNYEPNKIQCITSYDQGMLPSSALPI